MSLPAQYLTLRAASTRLHGPCIFLNYSKPGDHRHVRHAPTFASQLGYTLGLFHLPYFFGY
jgi:hypothetical protein